VTELSRHSAMTGDQLSVGENSGSHAFRHGHQHNIANSIDSPEGEFRQQTGCGGVFHLHRHAHCLFDHFLQIEIGPVQVRREDQTLRAWIDSAGKTDTDPLNRFARQRLLHPQHTVSHPPGGGCRVGGKGHQRPRKQASFQVHRSDRSLFRMDIDRNHYQVIIQL
jgi:hypothetical protein